MRPPTGNLGDLKVNGGQNRRAHIMMTPQGRGRGLACGLGYSQTVHSNKMKRWNVRTWLRTTVATRKALARVQDKLPPGPRLVLVASHRDAPPSDDRGTSSPSPTASAGLGVDEPDHHATSPSRVLRRRTRHCATAHDQLGGAREQIKHNGGVPAQAHYCNCHRIVPLRGA